MGDFTQRRKDAKNAKRKERDSRKYLAAAVILAATMLLLLLFSWTPFLEILELKSYDLRLTVLRPPLERPSDIVIVAIDESSRLEMEEAGIGWPWPRSIYSVLIQSLNEAGARVIAFDVTFINKTKPPQEDAALAQAIRASRAPVVLAATEEVVDTPTYRLRQPWLPLDSLLEAGADYGFANLNPDRDTVLREARLSVNGEPSLVVSILKRAGPSVDWDQVPTSSREGGDPQILINFAGTSRSIRTVGFTQAIQYQEALPAGVFKDKIVLVGRSLAVEDLEGRGSQADFYPSPYNLLGTVGASMPGVEFHANALNTILRGNFIRKAGTGYSWFLTALMAVLASAAALAFVSVRLKTAVFLLLFAGYLGLACLDLAYWDYWLPAVQPATAMLAVFGLNALYQYRASERERAMLRQAFKGYVSSQVMDEVLKNPEKLELGGTQMEATVLFSDIAGFSKVSEHITPPELATMLNNYFTRMGDAVMRGEGMINKYIGDSIMAIWGAPLPDQQHAAKACRTALAMHRIAESDGLLKTRIGLNTGSMVAGNLGHKERMEYTVIGDAVNLASRLEGANKAFGTSILISESTQALLQERFLLRAVDRIRVVGKEEPVHIFELLACLDDPLPDELSELTRSFQRIMQRYGSRKWQEAGRLLDEHLQRFPNDPVAITYRQRCRQFALSPPPPDWDGVHTLETK